MELGVAWLNANADQAALEFQPLAAAPLSRRCWGMGVVTGSQWIAAEAIEQIHQQQFLVLLLVLQAQLQ